MPITEELAFEARRDLAQFLVEAEHVLAAAITAPIYFDGQQSRERSLIDPEMLGLLREAWSEYERDAAGRLEITLSRIANASAAVLEEHGLYGAQLRFKLGLFRWRLQTYNQTRQAVAVAPPAPPTAPLVFPPWSVVGRAFKWLLRTIDVLLDSIVQALGIGKALKEIKEGTIEATEV